MLKHTFGAVLGLAVLTFCHTAQARYLQSDPIGLKGGISTYTYVSNSPLMHVDPLGLWQVTITAGIFWGGTVTFGNNSGQWNIGGYIGLADGVSGEFNPNESDRHACGTYYGVRAAGQIGAGDNVEATGYAGFNGDRSFGLSANDPFFTHQAWGIEEENGVMQPLGAPTFSGGGAISDGVGGTWYSGGGH